VVTTRRGRMVRLLFCVLGLPYQIRGPETVTLPECRHGFRSFLIKIILAIRTGTLPCMFPVHDSLCNLPLCSIEY